MSADGGAPQGGQGDPSRAPVVLLVDDEPDILGSLQLLLGRSVRKPRVLTAGSGPDGLEILRREPIDLLVSDFKMPGMDGIQFLVEARRICPGIRRVLITAYADDDLARRAEAEAGLSAFLSKATESKELLRAFEVLLSGTAQPPAGS